MPDRESEAKDSQQTILVVDDEPPLLRLLAFLMERRGYRVLTASNGEEALQLLRSHHPDLLVLDIMMPRLDGYQVAEILRADPELSSIPVVMLSAKAQDEDIARGMALGVATYVTKPFEPDHLAEIISKILSGQTVPPEVPGRGS